jgi:phosphonate transport system substrate-binding protein
MMEGLHRETGYYFTSAVPTNYITVVEAFGSSRADIALINSFSYLLAHDKYGVEAKLRAVRFGLDYYLGQIVARADSGINEVKDLDGKKFAFTDASSTSGYMFPLKMMKDAGVEPAATTFAMKHDNVITMVYQKQVDAGATFYSPPTEDGKARDARSRVLTQFPDVLERVKIIAITDKIPNDPFVFRKGLPAELVNNVIKGLKSYLKTAEGKDIFFQIYNMEDMLDVTDADYDDLRNTIRTLDLSIKDIIK